MKSENRLTGVILAAGFGTRMAPLTRLVAKPAIPFLNRPLIHYSLDNLNRAGVFRIWVNVHHLPETVEAAVAAYRRNQPKSAPVSLSFEESILGTAGVLQPLAEQLQNTTVLLCNGKIYFEEELSSPCEQHWKDGNVVTLVLTDWTPESRFNPVQVDREGQVVGFGRIPLRGEVRFHTYTGVQVLSSEYLEYLPTGYSDSVKDIFPELIRAGHRIGAYISEARWFENSTPASYLENSLDLWRALGGAEHRRDAVIGAGVSIGENTSLESVVLWDNCSVGNRAHLKRVIVTGGVTVRDGVVVNDAILWRDPTSGAEEYALWPLEDKHP